MPVPFCPTCGKAMVPNATFCPFDGTRLDATPTAQMTSVHASAPFGRPGPVRPSAPKRLNGCLTAFLVVVGFFIILGIIGASMNHGPSGPASDAGLGSFAAGSRSNDSNDNVAQPKQQHPHVILDISGSGENTTKKFYVSDDWDLAWSYDCSNFGQRGNFQIYISGDNGMSPEAGPNELDMQGDGTDHLHGGAGYRYLTMNSECNWAVKVISL